ncbi:hypothetical protein GIB67_026248 [Kingdonia uniflora]|uniref:Pectinesterase inhibitor domain-containing protein n=1 Tax=Kingdonia uniflora TaxID=39325 RepID=A0A7J7L9S9_9MAGN|nr:hypothetical protein GIB67_026248 [Kingdonia uniflora]
MATILSSKLSLLSLLVFFLRAISAATNENSTNFIRTSCNATLYPDLCYASLSRYTKSVRQSPAQLARIAVTVSLAKAKQMASYVTNISHHATNSGTSMNPRVVSALKDCFSMFSDTVYQIKLSLNEMHNLTSTSTGGNESFKFRMSNVQTWMSAALTNEDTCTDGFEEVPDDTPTKVDICNRVRVTMKFTSNALALINSFVANYAMGRTL